MKSLFALLLIVVQFHPTHSWLREITSNKDYTEVVKQADKPVGVFFYHHSIAEGEEFQSRTINVLKDGDFKLDILSERFMELATINCLNDNINRREDIAGCAKGKRQFLLFKKKQDDQPEQFSLRTLHDGEAFITEMVTSLFEDVLHLIFFSSQWHDIAHRYKGDKDIVVLYTNTLGGAEHYEFISFFLAHKEKYAFAVTNEEEIANKFGKKPEDTNAVWFFKCKQASRDESCEQTMLPWTDSTNPAAIKSFVLMQQLPMLSEMAADGSTIFDDVKEVHIVFILVDNDETVAGLTRIMSDVIHKCDVKGIPLKGVFVDRRKHGEIMVKQFGVSNDTVLPSLMIELRDKKRDMTSSLKSFRQVERPDPNFELTEGNIISFASQLVSDTDDYFDTLTQMNFVRCIDDNEWQELEKLNHDTLLGLCTSENTLEFALKDTCKTFKRDFRHLVRIINSDINMNFEFLYMDRQMEGMKGPTLMLSQNGIVKYTEGLPLKESSLIEDLLKWVNKELQLTLPLLPPSRADWTPLPPRVKGNENELVEGRDGLTKLQEDEVALHATNVRKSAFYSDDTLALTDDTFNATVKQSKLLLAFYYMPLIDDISFLVEPVIANVSKKVANDKELSVVPTTVAKINCEEEYLLCKQVYTYPTIHFYRHGVLQGTYDGPLHEQKLLDALRLHHQPGLLRLEGRSLHEFMEKSLLNTGSQVSVLGWFSSDSGDDFNVFKETADNFIGKIKFGYAVGESSRSVFPKEAVKSSILVSYAQKQLAQVLDGSTEPMSKMRVEQFLRKAEVSVFGEITMHNFHVYKSLNKSMLIHFINKQEESESVAWETTRRVAMETAVEDVLFTWMDLATDVAKEIRRSYLGGRRKENKEDIVVVDFSKAEVYLFPIVASGNSDVKVLSQWIMNVVKGVVKATKYLHSNSWKPLRQGIDFLHMIDKDMRYPGDQGHGDEDEDFTSDVTNDDIRRTNEENGNHSHDDVTRTRFPSLSRNENNDKSEDNDGNDFNVLNSNNKNNDYNDDEDDDNGYDNLEGNSFKNPYSNVHEEL